MYRLVCQKPAHFLSAQMALLSTFFQMFIVPGMYNFAIDTKGRIAIEWNSFRMAWAYTILDSSLLVL